LNCKPEFWASGEPSKTTVSTASGQKCVPAGCKDAVSSAPSVLTIADHLDFLENSEYLEFDYSRNGQDKFIEDHLWVNGSSRPVSVRHVYSKILIYPKTATTIWFGSEYLNIVAEPGMGPMTGEYRPFVIKERLNRLCFQYKSGGGEQYLLEFTGVIF
jgi:hypothetical protein